MTLKHDPLVSESTLIRRALSLLEINKFLLGVTLAWTVIPSEYDKARFCASRQAFTQYRLLDVPALTGEITALECVQQACRGPPERQFLVYDQDR